MRYRAFIAALTLALSGCTTLADVSAGEVGCAPAEIVISNEHTTWGGRTWSATCNGQQFHCSSHGGGDGSTSQVSCAPAGGTAVPGGASAAPGGCQFDTQCKGDRICREGACVDAVVTTPAPEPAPTTAAPEASTPPSPDG